jgi:hypothetical protein
MIVLPPGFFRLKIIEWFICPARNLRLEIKFLVPNFHHQKVFRHRNFGGHCEVLVVFYFQSHTYNYLVNGQRAKGVTMYGLSLPTRVENGRACSVKHLIRIQHRCPLFDVCKVLAIDGMMVGGRCTD